MEYEFLFLIISSHLNKTLFFLCLISGVFISISANSWFISWVGLELNLLSFIPILAIKTNTYASESALKYFLVQALASTFLISRAIAIFLVKTAPILLILASLLLKIGAAPLHFWLPTVIQGISWTECLVLMTVQKVAPAILISYTIFNRLSQPIIQTFSIVSRMIGAIGGLNQTLLRKIIAYSSISHIAWILAAICHNITLWFYYMLVYSLISTSLVFFLKINQIFHFKQISLIKEPQEKIRYFLGFFSLGGLPPFLGFFPKIIVISTLTITGNFLWLVFLLIRSLLTLFFYTRLIVRAFVISTPSAKSKVDKQNLISKRPYMLVILNFWSILFPLMFITLY